MSTQIRLRVMNFVFIFFSKFYKPPSTFIQLYLTFTSLLLFNSTIMCTPSLSIASTASPPHALDEMSDFTLADFYHLLTSGLALTDLFTLADLFTLVLRVPHKCSRGSWWSPPMMFVTQCNKQVLYSL